MSLVFVAVFSLYLVGCTQSEPVQDSYIPQNPQQSLEWNMKEAQVYCGSLGDCPENIGQVIHLTPTSGSSIGIMQCTGSLVAPNIIATNAHCIPEDLRYSGASCSNRVGIKFPSTQGKSEEIQYCDKILVSSDLSPQKESDEVRRPDYAFFSLKTASQRAPLPIGRSGVPENEPLHSYVIDPMSRSSVLGRVMKKTCKAVKGTILVPNDSLFSPLNAIFGSDCSVIGGNSGSPLLNVRGEAVALIFAKIETEELRRAFQSKVQVATFLSPGALTTNLACLSDLDTLGLARSPKPAECNSIKAQSALDEDVAVRNYKEILLEQLRTKARSWVRSAPEQFKFRFRLSPLESQSDRYRFHPAIECIKSNIEWYRDPEKEVESVFFDSDIYVMKFQLDTYLRATPSLYKFSYESWLAKFDQTALNQLGETESEVGQIGRHIDGEMRFEKLKTRICTQEDLKTEYILGKDDLTL